MKLSQLSSGLAVLILGLGVWGCSDDSSSNTLPPPNTGTGQGSFGLVTREVPQLNFPSLPSGQQAGTPEAVRAFPNLSFNRAIYIRHLPDGSNRMLVAEQDGVIRLFDNVDSVTSSTVYMDISSRVSFASNEEGLLGLAFDPDFATNGFFYVHYSAASPRRTVISRFSRLSSSQGDPSTEQVLYQLNQPFSNHNGGMIEFGPDGYLYAALGDGGSGGDPLNSGQDTTTHLGALLRIDPNGGSPYAIPSDNPFVGGAGADEIWAFGLRNPWRFSFDRTTGRLWLGDVGQGAREEISVVTRGANLGWNVYEGTLSFNNPGGTPASAFTQPVIDYDRNQGSTVVGGYVYRGVQYPNLQGLYFYGDYGSGRVWYLSVDGQLNVLANTEMGTINGLSSFGEDQNGELFAVSLSGEVWRIQEAAGGPGGGPFPQQLSQTGLFSDVASLTPAPGVIEYDVNAPFWSDGALKRRWIALPGTTTIGFSSTNAWTFPVGTVLVKQFDMELSPGNTLRLETRVLIHETQGQWDGYAYRWNASQSDADLLPDFQDVPLTVQDPTAPGGSLSFTYHIPSRNECGQCHNSASGFVLGVRTRQLNRDFNYPAQLDNQLRAWNNINLFNNDIGSETQYAALPDPTSTSGTLDERSRAYLQVNCSICHRPGGPAPGGIDMRFDTALANTNLLDIPPTEGDLGLTNPRRIRTGEKETSVLWERLRRLDSTRMPPIGSNRVDTDAETLLGSWIDGL